MSFETASLCAQNCVNYNVINYNIIKLQIQRAVVSFS